MIPPEPGPDPPTPSSYNFSAEITYADLSEAGLEYELSLSYKEDSDSEWVSIGSSTLTSKVSGLTTQVAFTGIPGGCHSVKLTIGPVPGGTMYLYIKKPDDNYHQDLVYEAGSSGWNQDLSVSIYAVVRDP